MSEVKKLQERVDTLKALETPIEKRLDEIAREQHEERQQLELYRHERHRLERLIYQVTEESNILSGPHAPKGDRS